MNPKITEIEILLDKMNHVFKYVRNSGLDDDRVELELFKRYASDLNNCLNGIKETKKELPEIKEAPLKKEPVEIKTELPKIQEVVKTEKKTEVNIHAFEKSVPVNKTEIKKKSLVVNDDSGDEERTAGIGSKLSASKKTIGDKIKSAPGKNLQHSIDLNERFFFIRELFRGDQQAFESNIRRIDGMSAFADAKKYIETELSPRYKWTDTETVEKLIDAVKGKFNLLIS